MVEQTLLFRVARSLKRIALPLPDVAQQTLEEFGDAVRAACAHKGWGLDDLGGALTPPMSKSYLSRIQNGKRQISPKTVGKLVEALGLHSEWVNCFLGLGNPPPVDELVGQQPRIDSPSSLHGHPSASAELVANLVSRNARLASDNQSMQQTIQLLAYQYSGEGVNDFDTAIEVLHTALLLAKRVKSETKKPALERGRK